MNQEEANRLCSRILVSLSEWRALVPALQSGGVERKMSAPVQEALCEFQNLVVLPEYRQIDYALIEEGFEGARLKVDTAFEFKFNYASQISEICSRIPSAIDQVTGYKDEVKAKHAFVLYVIAAPFANKLPSHRRDAGWGYWNKPLAAAISAVHEYSVIDGRNRLLSDASHIGVVHLYCAMLDAT